MLFDFEWAEKEIVLLNVAANGRNHFGRSNKLAIHSDLALHAKIVAPIPKVEHIEQRRFARSARSQNGQYLFGPRQTAHIFNEMFVIVVKCAAIGFGGDRVGCDRVIKVVRAGRMRLMLEEHATGLLFDGLLFVWLK